MTVSMGSGGSYVGLSWKDSSESSIHNVINTSACTLYAPLKSSLILSKGAGDPTWSRATKAWGFNELGYLEELDSGCAFFGGARLVRNLVKSNSENVVFTAAGSTPPTVTNGVTYLDQICSQIDIPITAGGYSATRAVANSSNADMVLGRGYSAQYSVALSRPLVGAETIFLYFLTASKGVSQAVINSSSPNLSAFTTILGVPGDTPTATVGAVCNVQTVSTFASAVTIYITKLQVVEVTGYDASYVPEYVSVGVEASPYFGAGIDGAKYFETDWQGAPIAAANLLGFRREAAATNNLLFNRYFQGGAGVINQGWFIAQGSGSDKVTNGGFDADTGWTKGTGWTISGGTAVVTAAIDHQLKQNIGAVAGRTYTITFTLGAGWAGQLYCAIGMISDPTSTTRANAAGTYSFHCIAGSSTPGILYFYPNSACTGTIDNVSVRESVIQVTQATGLDGIANTATTLTATAADAIILQPITLASAARCASAYVKRKTGTGTISFTQDGGSTWTDITSQINSSTWSRVQITSTLANPSVGFKISTSGDAIDVDCAQNEAGAVATSPIVTTIAAVTRNADSLTYQTASNWSDTEGTAYIEAQPLAWVAGGAIGSATNGLLLSAANSGATASDGTNTANGPAGSPSGREKLAMRWGGGAMTVASGGVVGTAGTYDGGMGLASVGIAVNSSVYCGRVAIYDYAMTDAELQAITA